MLKDRFKVIENDILNPELKAILSGFAEASAKFSTHKGNQHFQTICIILRDLYSDDNSISVLTFMSQGKASKKANTVRITPIPIATETNTKKQQEECEDCPETIKPAEEAVPPLEVFEPKPKAKAKKKVVKKVVKPDENIVTNESQANLVDKKKGDEPKEHTKEDDKNMDSIVDSTVTAGEPENKIFNPKSVKDIKKYFKDKEEIADYGKKFGLTFDNMNMHQAATHLFKSLSDK